MIPSTIPEELCTGFGVVQPPASLRFQAGSPTFFHRNISKSIPSWQGAITLIALPMRQSKAKICPRKPALVSHTQNPTPSPWSSTDITLHKQENLKPPFKELIKPTPILPVFRQSSPTSDKSPRWDWIFIALFWSSAQGKLRNKDFSWHLFQVSHKNSHSSPDHEPSCLVDGRVPCNLPSA